MRLELYSVLELKQFSYRLFLSLFQPLSCASLLDEQIHTGSSRGSGRMGDRLSLQAEIEVSEMGGMKICKNVIDVPGYSWLYKLKLKYKVVGISTAP